MTRIHGDFHLGQVLVASGDIYIIDFEGEPGRPLAERRAKASPLRDVAGLLRSFDYAAAATLDPKRITGAQVPHEQRAEFVRRLRDGAKRAFLDAYRESGAGAENADLLDFFLIEKAAYELAYEAANRPAWLPIPIEGLADLVRAARAGRKEQAMNVRAAPSAPPLDRHDTEALAHALHGDPFRLLGPHDTPAGPVVRAFLPGAESVDVLRRSRRRADRPA